MRMRHELQQPRHLLETCGRDMERFNPIIGDPVADSAALLRRLAFFMLFLVLPVAAIIGRRAVVIVVPVTIALLVIAAILDGGYRSLRQSLPRLFLSPTTLVTLLFFGWCAVSLLWTPFPKQGWERLFGTLTAITMILIGYLALPERMRSSNLYLLPIGVFAAALLALAVRFTVLTENRPVDFDEVFQRGLLVLVLLFWPAFTWLRSRHRDVAALAISIPIIAAVSVASHKAALFAFLVGAFGYVLAKIFKSKGSRSIAIVTAGLVALAPLLPFILQPLAALVPETAFANSLNVARQLMLSDPMQVITGQGFDALGRSRMAGTLDFQAPTSALFQIWYELGIVGAWSVALIIFAVISKAGSKHAPLAPGMVAGFLSAYAFATMGSGTAQSWWTTALASAVLIFLAMTRGQFRTTRPRIFIVRS